ncbi:cytosolic leucyl tRNA synthetase [Geranomyces variabilis]|uniref:Cytosolic leucyl tRNA synthetase n=1 Tax=Geranomyces variabilis TaxID=109894 RepID=A0AAD5TMR4_9FUNG|nr:cytosolic leucyl tRNA synthetase [Geranomyces variabilis]
MTTARSEYRKANTGTGAGSSAVQGDNYEGMHVELVLRYIELQTLMMSPITPHWSEYIWSQLLHKPESIKKALWPKQTGTPDEGLLAAAAYIRGLGSKIRSAEDQVARKEKKKKGNAAATPAAASPTEPRLRLFVACSYPAWQDAAITILKSTYKDGVFAGTEKQLLAAAGLMKNKAVMPFVAGIKSAVEANGPTAFERKLAFDEVATLESNLDFVRRELSVLKIKDVELIKAEEVKEEAGKFAAEDIRKADMATPSQPTYRIV